MKKIFTLALSAVAALSINAIGATPGYVMGDIAELSGTDKDTWAPAGDYFGWNPAAPVEITETEEGVYEGLYWVKKQGYFCFGQGLGADSNDWSGFASTRWYSDSQELESGKPTAMYFGGEGPGAWTITVASAAGAAISLKVDTNAEEVTVVNLSEGVVEASKEPALIGSITSLGVNWDQLLPLTKGEGTTWYYDFPQPITLDTDDAFKICGADGAWTTVNFGGVSGEYLVLDTPYTCVQGNAGADFKVEAETTVASVVLDMAEDLTTATITIKSTSAAIDGIEIDSNEPVEYYNLQGVKVAGDLPAGLYIAKQGVKTSKVVVK